MGTNSDTSLKRAVSTAVGHAKSFSKSQPGVKFKGIGGATTSSLPPLLPPYLRKMLDFKDPWHFIELQFEGHQPIMVVVPVGESRIVVWQPGTFDDWGLK